MSIIKLIATVSLAVAVLTMVTSNQLSIYASPTTEDDGWTDDEVDNDEDVEDMYDGSPWEFEDGNDEEESTDKLTNNDDDNEKDDDDPDNDNGQVECSDGSSVATQAECPVIQEQKECYDGITVVANQPCPPPKDPSPYCNTPAAKHSINCWDVKDYSDNTGLYPCNDGTQKADWKDCVDVSSEAKDLKKEKDSNKKTEVVHKTEIINNPSASSSASATATAAGNEADVSNCKLDGSTDGIQQKFNPVRYQACGLYTSADKAYYDGFVAGCMQVGNTKLICETVANSNIEAPPAQTQTATQPTQAIQPAAVS